MNTKGILMSILMIGVVAMAAGAGTFAYFSDTEKSTGNTFTAGTLDLKLSDEDETEQNGVTASITCSPMAPGQSVGSKTITLKNAGSLDAATLDIGVSYTEADGTWSTDDTVDKTADEFADELIVDTFTYGGTDLLTALPAGTDADGDGIDMKELAAADLSGQAGIDAGATKDLVIKVHLKDVGNDFQNDGITVTFSFDLKQ